MPSIFTQSALFARAINFPALIQTPLRALIVGPQAGLHRYNTASEKVSINLGSYSPGVDTDYSYPAKATGSIVDLDYAKLYVDDARLRYFSDAIGSGNTIIPVSGQPNRIKVSAGSTVFKGNGSGYPRSSDLEADVQAGDIVYVRGVISSTNIELTTYVQDFVADTVASSIGSATVDASNKAGQSATTSNSFLSGTANCVVISSVSGTNYDGLPTGDISETYTVVVTQASVGGDATTAKLQVTSASGRDNQASVTPAAFAAATSIGTRGLTVTWNNTVSSCSGQDFALGQTWSVTVNQVFVAPTAGTAAGTYTGVGAEEDTTYILTVSRGGKYLTDQAVANPTTTPALSTVNSGGSVPAATYYAVVTYKGATSGETLKTSPEASVVTSGASSTLTMQSPPAVNGATQYFLYVGTVSGGPYFRQGAATNIGTALTITSYTGSGTNPPVSNNSLGLQPNLSPPQITVTTTTGIDLSGPTSFTFTGSGVTFSTTALTVGTKGITWAPPASSYQAKGDKFTILATATKAGAYKTLVLGQNLPTTPVDMTTATDLELRLYVPKDGLVVTKNRLESAPNVNWVAAANKFTTKANMTATDARWTAGTKYPITSGTLFLEYREWLQDNIGTVSDITDLETVSTLLGSVDPDNPLAEGVYKALQNTNGKTVRYIGVSNPSDTASWTDVLGLIDSLENVYGLAPLTTDTTILADYVAHVQSQSAEEVGGYRVLWYPLTVDENIVVVDATKTTDDGAALATLKDDPNTTGTQYTYLKVPAGNAKFVTNGVQVGDTVRYLYTTDGFGNSTWTEFTVATVVNEDTLIITPANSVPVNSAQKVEVWHPNTKTEITNSLIAKAGAIGDKLVRAYWPDTAVDGDTTFPGYICGAILAGLTSAIPPQQGVTNVELAGITDVPRTTAYFNNAQRIALAAGGVWVLEKDPVTGLVYTRYATTTDTSSLSNKEEMIVRDTHGVLYAILSQLSNYIGVANIVDDTLNQMVTDIRSVSNTIKQQTNVSRLGPMASEIALTSVRQHATLLDRVVVTLSITTPFPVNKIILSVVV
jgi:hypothetical protein